MRRRRALSAKYYVYKLFVIVYERWYDMRVAVCFAGQVRFLQSVIDGLLEHIVKHYDADVFCHTWTSNKLDGTPERTKDDVLADLQPLQPCLAQVDDFVLTEHIQHPEILARFADKSDHWYGSRTPRTISHYASVYRANELKKRYEQTHGFTYDWVFRVRYDMEVHQPWTWEVEKLDGSCFYMHTESSSNGVNPEVYFGNSKVMDAICGMYTMFQSYYEKGVILFDETVFCHHIHEVGVPIIRIAMPHGLRRQW